MEDKINKIKGEFLEKVYQVKSKEEIFELKSQYLGKNSEISNLLSNLKNLNDNDKKLMGKQINDLKVYIGEKIEEELNNLLEHELNNKLEASKIDITLPGTKVEVGGVHPLNMIIETLEEYFISLGYEVKTGPEVETINNNFTMLNISENHPSRDENDTFYLNDELLLRTQTSAVQIREMLKNSDKLPFKMICPGKTYRKDEDDATHSHQFMQLEGLVVGENITLTDLKGTLEGMLKVVFGKDAKMRFRASFFPFTEPSYEVDVKCFKCGGNGCSICKNTGWIEILGSGMVHPKVLNNCGFDANKYQGFAFGVGIERLAMLKYGINDIRKFYTNDLEFLENFNKLDGGLNENI